MDLKPNAPTETPPTQGQTPSRLANGPSPLREGSDAAAPSQWLEKLVKDLSDLGVDARAVDLVLTLVQRFTGRESGFYAELVGRITRLEDAVQAIAQGQGFVRTPLNTRPPCGTAEVSLPENRRRDASIEPLSPTSGDRPLAVPDTIPTSGADGPSRSPYLDAGRAASYLGVTLNSLYGIVERGHLEPLRGPRRRYRFTTAMLDEYLGRKGGGR